MTGFLRGGRLVVDLGLALLALGLLGLLLMAWVEYLHTPDISLIDAYWMGREPLTSVSVSTVLIGSTLALVAGVLVALLGGSWIRKLLAVAAVVAPAFWWLIALGVIPLPRYGPIAPATFAYSLPETAALFVLLPALLASALALVPRRAQPTSRMAAVHRDASSR
jgi:hypothetical protein